jgi:hypothetical protein
MRAIVEALIVLYVSSIVPGYWQNNSRSTPEALGDILLPAPWLSSTLVACGGNGYVSKTWHLPPSWNGTPRVSVSRITVDGLVSLGSVPVKDGVVDMTLEADQVVAIKRNL